MPLGFDNDLNPMALEFQMSTQDMWIMDETQEIYRITEGLMLEFISEGH